MTPSTQERLSTAQNKAMVALFREPGRYVRKSWRARYEIRDARFNLSGFLNRQTAKILLDKGYLKQGDRDEKFIPNYNLIDRIHDNSRMLGEWYKKLQTL